MSHVEGLLNRLPGPMLRVSDPMDAGYVLRICISNKFPDDADTAGLGTKF